MSDLAIADLTVRYFTRKTAALDGVSLDVEPGEVVGVTGPTGAGKSTLCLAAAGFVPRVVRAAISGRVEVTGLDATKASLADTAGKVGIVFSSPSLQLSASKPTVRAELAFGLENLAVDRSRMDPAIDAVLERLGIAHLAERDPLALSGGEQQRVAIAGIVVMGTQLVVLDEPAAQLDPEGTQDVAALLAGLAGAGRSLLVAEHATEILGSAKRCLVIGDGRTIALAPPGEALSSEVLSRLGLEAPDLVQLGEAAGVKGTDLFNEDAVVDGLARLRRTGAPHSVATPLDPQAPATGASTLQIESFRPPESVDIVVRDLRYEYSNGVRALRGINLAIAPGETIAIVGRNGSGKTTLIKHLNGLLRAQSGSVEISGEPVGDRPVAELARQVGFVFQNPDDQLFNSRVENEVAFGPRNLGFKPGVVDQLVRQALELVALSDERATNPYDLGFSLRKLVALASVLAMETPVLVLDEPTTGQDGAGVARVGSIVDAWAASGRTVVAITHDMQFAARHFGRVVVMRQGEIVLDGRPDEVFAAPNTELLASTGLRPPTVARVAARLGLDVFPLDARALLAALR